MIQVIVTGKVVDLTKYEAKGARPAYFVAELHEKVYEDGKTITRIWNVTMDTWTGEKLEKAMVQIKWFGFICSGLKMVTEWQGDKIGTVIWLNVRAQSYFTL